MNVLVSREKSMHECACICECACVFVSVCEWACIQGEVHW